MALGSTQPLIQMSTRNIPGVGGETCKAVGLNAICELSGKCGSFDGLQPYGPSQSVTGIALNFFPLSALFLRSTIHM
jgi:hypothetical protein